MRTIYLIGLMVTFAFSDFTLIYKMEDNIHEIIEYKDDKNAKLSYTEGDNNSSYAGQYLIDKRRYSVIDEDGNLTYQDLDKMDKEATEIEDDLNISEDNCTVKIKQPYFKLKEKKGTKIVAGIEGEIWEVTSMEDGEEFNETIVVSNNKVLLDAMKKSFDVLKLFGEGPYGMEIGDDTESMMIVADGFVLLSAQGLEFVSLSHEKLADGVIKLPEGATEEIEELSEEEEEETKLGKEALKNVLESNEVCISKKE